MSESRYTARERFRMLIGTPETLEVEWQRLFADHPCILSEGLPLNIDEGDIKPFARPGRAEPDFLMFPQSGDPLSPSGLIEIKRPSTRLLKIPRRDVLTLSSDASTALAQARKYASDQMAEVLIRPDRLVMIGNPFHIFIIAGMSGEIANKVTTELLRLQLRELLPDGVTLIPYDILLKAFESKFPKVHVLHTTLPHANASLEHLLRALENAYRSYEAYALSDSLLDQWASLEEEYFRLSHVRPEESRLINRQQFEIDGSVPDELGRRPLATEAPNPSMFALSVCRFIANVVVSGREVGIASSLSSDVSTLWTGCGAYPSD